MRNVEDTIEEMELDMLRMIQRMRRIAKGIDEEMGFKNTPLFFFYLNKISSYVLAKSASAHNIYPDETYAAKQMSKKICIIPISTNKNVKLK